MQRTAMPMHRIRFQGPGRCQRGGMRRLDGQELLLQGGFALSETASSPGRGSVFREASDQVPPQPHRLLGSSALLGRLRRHGQGYGGQWGGAPALTLQQPMASVDVSRAAACHQQSSLATKLRVERSSIEAPQLRIRSGWV